MRTYKGWDYFGVFMAVVAALRISNAATLTPWSNFTPIGAMALFGGARLKGWAGYLFPLVTLLVSDLFINGIVFGGKYGLFYDGFYWIYAAMALVTLIGQLGLRRISPAHFLLAAIAGSGLWWLVVDFGVWLGGGIDIRSGLPMSRDGKGLLQCYVQGWPYARNFAMGTIVYGTLLFGADALFRSRNQEWQTA